MTPDPNHLLQFFLILSLIGGIAVAAIKIFGKPKKQSLEQPLAVREWKDYATKDELAEVEKRLSGEIACLHEGARRREEKQDIANQKLHDRISETRKELSAEIKDNNAHGEERSRRIHQRIDTVQAQIAQLPLELAKIVNTRRHD